MRDYSLAILRDIFHIAVRIHQPLLLHDCGNTVPFRKVALIDGTTFIIAILGNQRVQFLITLVQCIRIVDSAKFKVIARQRGPFRVNSHRCTRSIGHLSSRVALICLGRRQLLAIHKDQIALVPDGHGNLVARSGHGLAVDNHIVLPAIGARNVAAAAADELI